MFSAELDATGLLVWGAVVHFVCDWLLQNEWMALNKMKRRAAHRFYDGGGYAAPGEADPWWDRHPAAYVHSGIHAAGALLVFPWPAALTVGVAHLLIDTRKPVVWWSKLIRQTQPSGQGFDIGADVRIWVDQVWHVGILALVALVVASS